MRCSGMFWFGSLRSLSAASIVAMDSRMLSMFLSWGARNIALLRNRRGSVPLFPMLWEYRSIKIAVAHLHRAVLVIGPVEEVWVDYSQMHLLCVVRHVARLVREDGDPHLLGSACAFRRNRRW